MGRKKPIPPFPTTNPDISPAAFAHSATKIATSQIIRSVGFSAAHRSALDALSTVAGKHLSAVAASATAAAFSGGRTQSNLQDVVTALESLAASGGGFRGASNLGYPILSSSTLEDLTAFVESSDEIPFAQAVPRRSPPPPCRRLRLPDAVGRVGHVPGWLPAFPDVVREREGCREGEVGEKLFGCLGSEERTDVKERGREFVDERMSIGLPKRRERVRFEIGVREGGFGVGSRNGVCRGGKRIFCAKSSNDDEITMTKGNSSLNGDFAQPLRYYRRRNRL